MTEKFWEVEVRGGPGEAVFTAAKSEAEGNRVGDALAAKMVERNPKLAPAVFVRPLA